MTLNYFKAREAIFTDIKAANPEAYQKFVDNFSTDSTFNVDIRVAYLQTDPMKGTRGRRGPMGICGSGSSSSTDPATIAELNAQLAKAVAERDANPIYETMEVSLIINTSNDDKLKACIDYFQMLLDRALITRFDIVAAAKTERVIKPEHQKRYDDLMTKREEFQQKVDEFTEKLEKEYGNLTVDHDVDNGYGMPISLAFPETWWEYKQTVGRQVITVSFISKYVDYDKF